MNVLTWRKSIPIVILYYYIYSFKNISPSRNEILYCDRGSCFCASLSCDFLNPTSVRQTLFRPFKCQVHYIVLQTRCEFDAHFLTYLALQSRQKMGKIVQYKPLRAFQATLLFQIFAYYVAHVMHYFV